jgi:Cu2+-exporting ATPase
VVLTIPVILYSEMVQTWLHFTPPQFPGSGWVAPILGTAVFVYGGTPFLRGGAEEARARQPGMMLLISLAITVAFLASAATALNLFDLDFWWELALLIDIMLLVHDGTVLGALALALNAQLVRRVDLRPGRVGV